ncbi:hypothetical protein BYT27DRAFT_7193057 [Phlegmacium glaucopus]|nr:hypothetical protein BYT27DRAFT_7193057 [Phlegmacium glaucopus]
MTEYDYSPEAIERQLATEQRIEKWVDQTSESSPANPFISLPGEHTSPVPQPQSQPAFYATSQGVISPTYSSSRKHGHSQYPSPSPRGTPITMPQGNRLVSSRSFSTLPSPVMKFHSPPCTPYPTGSPLNPSPHSSAYKPSPTSHPRPSRSQPSFHSVHSSNVNASPVIQQQPGGNTYVPYNSPYQLAPTFHPSHSQSSFHSVHSSKIHANPVIQQQPGSNTYPPYNSPYQPSSTSHPSHSQSSFHSFHSVHSSHIYVNPVIQQQPGGNTYPYFQPAPPQPVQVLVNKGGGGYVVVPAPGQQVQVMTQQPVYEAQNKGDNQNFFGKLKSLGMKHSKSKTFKER